MYINRQRHRHPVHRGTQLDARAPEDVVVVLLVRDDFLFSWRLRCRGVLNVGRARAARTLYPILVLSSAAFGSRVSLPLSPILHIRPSLSFSLQCSSEQERACARERERKSRSRAARCACGEPLHHLSLSWRHVSLPSRARI